jgi:predicted permease
VFLVTDEWCPGGDDLLRLNMHSCLQDLRYALRLLVKNSGFTAITILTLALGIGANTTLFSVVNGVLINPLPYSDPNRLVALYSRTAEFDRYSISYPNFLDWAHDNHSFSDLAAYRGDNFNLTGTGLPERVSAEMLSASFFPLLGVKPVLGRTFRPEEDQLGTGPVVLISEGLWKRRFGSDRNLLGKSLTLSGNAYTVVGVIPAGFHFQGNNFDPHIDVYVPIGEWNDPTFRDRNVAMGMDAIARLKPGVTFEQAKADIEAVGKHLAEEYPDANKGRGISIFPLRQDMVGNVRLFLLVLLGAVGFVLLIACVNVANLLLAQSASRIRELSVRIALGASRGRMLRQLLTESVVLSGTGGVLGLLLVLGGTHATLKLLPEALPRAEEIHIDTRVLLFTFAVSVLGGILFGLVPAIKTYRPDVHESLKEGGRGASGTRHHAQGVFVVVEMALALILLAGTGLMVRSLVRLWSVDPGFDPHNLLTFFVSSPAVASRPDASRAQWRLMNEKLNSLAEVQSASLIAAAMPFQGDSEVPFWIEGQPKPLSQSDMKQTLFYLVQADYLKAMRIPLKRGRFLSPQDTQRSPLVAVIDDRFAKLVFDDAEPLGKRINFEVLGSSAEIVGVVGHVNQWGLDSDSQASIQAQCYFQIAQIGDRFVPLVANHIGVVLRAEGSPLAQVGSIRHTLDEINSQMVMYQTQTMEQVISASLAGRRFSMILLGSFSVLALVLACVGIYGVISYLVAQRTHDIGVRIALGASRWQVLRMVLGQSATMALSGVVIGLVAAFMLTRLMANMLFGISARDPLTFLTVAFFLSLVAVLASYIPAWRASKLDPIIALHCE